MGWVTDFAAGPRGTLYASRDWAVERLAFRGGELLGLSQPSGLLRVPRAD